MEFIDSILKRLELARKYIIEDNMKNDKNDEHLDFNRGRLAENKLITQMFEDIKKLIAK